MVAHRDLELRVGSFSSLATSYLGASFHLSQSLPSQLPVFVILLEKYEGTPLICVDSLHEYDSGSEKGVFWKRGLFRNAHFLEILEILEILENPQTLEIKGESNHFLEILEILEILERF